MLSYFDMHDVDTLERRIGEKSPNLFKTRPGRSQLEISRLFRTRVTFQNDDPTYEGNRSIRDVQELDEFSNVWARFAIHIPSLHQIHSLSLVLLFACPVAVVQCTDWQNNDSMQLFTIQHQHTWATLDISESLFRALIEKYGIFYHIWDCAFVYGRRWVGNEFEFPGCRVQRTPIVPGQDTWGRSSRTEAVDTSL
jgi:hypothetical protein